MPKNNFEIPELRILNGLRGLTALYILIHHSRLLLTQPYKSGLAIHPEYYTFFEKTLVYIFGIFKFGHEAVLIFFVLSGFVIHLKQSNSNFNYNEFKVAKFIRKRVMRIYPTLITVILFCVLIDYVSLRYAIHINDISDFKYTWKLLLENILLIPNTEAWGRNFPLWSLKHEWMFYLIYPILLYLNNIHKLLSIAILILLLVSYLMGLRIPYIENVAYTISVWYLGVLLAEFYNKEPTLLKRYLPLVCLFGIPYFFIDRHVMQNYPILDITFGLLSTGFIYFLLKYNSNFVTRFVNKFNFIGSFSYTLYLLHWPILIFIKNILINHSITKELPYHYGYVILATIIILPITYIIYSVTEKPAVEYKNKL